MADTKISDLAAVTDVLGTDEYVLARSGDTNKITAADLGAGLVAGALELDYVERTSDLTVSATTVAGANTLITGNSVLYDGSTRICVEVYIAGSAASQFMDLTIWDGATDLGAIGDTSSAGSTILGRRFLTPSAGSHTFTVKAYRGTGSATVFAGSGGTSGQYLPAYLRITRA
jgi:hypothetical protein